MDLAVRRKEIRDYNYMDFFLADNCLFIEETQPSHPQGTEDRLSTFPHPQPIRVS